MNNTQMTSEKPVEQKPKKAVSAYPSFEELKNSSIGSANSLDDMDDMDDMDFSMPVGMMIPEMKI